MRFKPHVDACTFSSISGSIDHGIRLDILDRTLALTHQLFELGLGGTDLKEWNTALRGMPHSLTVTQLAQGSNLLVGHTNIHDHSPILFCVFSLSQRVALVGEVVIQNWHACDKLGSAVLVPIDPGTVGQDCSQAN